MRMELFQDNSQFLVQEDGIDMYLQVLILVVAEDANALMVLFALNLAHLLLAFQEQLAVVLNGTTLMVVKSVLEQAQKHLD